MTTYMHRAARIAGGVWRLSLQTCSTYIIFASPSQAPFNGPALRTACSTNTAKPFASQAARGSACDIHGKVQGDAAAAAYRREQTVRVQVEVHAQSDAHIALFEEHVLLPRHSLSSWTS